MGAIKNDLMLTLLKCGVAYVNYALGAYNQFILRNGVIYMRYCADERSEYRVGHIDDIHVWDNMDYDLSGVSSITEVNIREA